jgi:hypothetical protein
MSRSSTQLLAIGLWGAVVVIVGFVGMKPFNHGRLLSDTELRESARGADPAPCNGSCPVFTCRDIGGLCPPYNGNPTACNGSSCFYCSNNTQYNNCDNSFPRDCRVTDFNSKQTGGCGGLWTSECNYNNPNCVCTQIAFTGSNCDRPTPVFTPYTDPNSPCVRVISP